MDGLIGTRPVTKPAINPTEIAQAKATTNPVTPTTKPAVAAEWRVDRPQTVQGQIAGIIAENSPLQQLATTSATQQANARGLVNSSMAVGAAQDANIRAALPIAQQDAQTNAQAGQFNAGEANRTSLFNTELASKEGMFATEQAGLNDRFSQELASKEGMFQSELAQNMEQFNLSEANKVTLMEMEQQFKQTIQNSANAATMFNAYQQGVAAIMTSPNLDAAGKETAIANLTTGLRDGVAAQDAVSGLNIESMVFPETQATTATTATTAAADQAAETTAAPTAAQAAWDAEYDRITQGSATTTRQINDRKEALAQLGPRP